MHVCVYACVCMCVCMCVHVCACVCMCVCMCVHVCTCVTFVPSYTLGYTLTHVYFPMCLQVTVVEDSVMATADVAEGVVINKPSIPLGEATAPSNQPVFSSPVQKVRYEERCGRWAGQWGCSLYHCVRLS